VDLLEPLAFLLARLLNGLCTRLATRALATDELRLRLRLENRPPHERTLRLPVPSLDPKSFLKLLQLDLAAHPPEAPVIHVGMEMHPLKPRFTQAGLFIPAAPEPVKLELTLKRIQAIVGEGRVGAPELLDTHRPDAFRLRGQTNLSPSGAGHRSSWPASARRGQTDLSQGAVLRGAPPGPGQICLSPLPLSPLPLRLFRPPRPARVALASGRPGFIAAEGIRGKVLDLAGPWRTSGDWWTSDPWSRDEWDIALSDGALYRLYCEPRGWFVEGSYD
jgi:protein ImuB